jgi:hypothetical protein
MGGGEEEADEVFSLIGPAIPRKREYNGFEGLIVINGEDHSGHTENTAKQYVSVNEYAQKNGRRRIQFRCKRRPA